MSSPPPKPTLPRIIPSQPITITTEPLTPVSFSPFGTAILPPLAQHLRRVPHNPPPPLHPPHQTTPQPANQNTALKTSPISPLTNTYPPSSPPSTGQVSIFSCFPRTNTHIDRESSRLSLAIPILERHPFTTQTFCPFNYSTPSSGPTYFLVVVAPSLDQPGNPPDLAGIRAFVAPVVVEGGVGAAVTYNPGTWHAPMVVLGGRRVDFLVTQFANGVADMDCQEVLVGEEDGHKVVTVDLVGLGLGEGEETGLWRAKL